MKIRNGKDFWAGLMFLGAGIGFMIVSRNYPMGTAVRMGPAYFPTVLGGMMAVLGAIIFVRAFFSQVHHSVAAFPFRWVMLVAGGVLAGILYASASWWAGMDKSIQLIQYGLNGLALFMIIGAFGPRPLVVILISVILFGYMLKPFGLVISAAILIFLSAWGGHEFKLREVIFLFAALAMFSVLTFIYGLSLPIGVWPDLG